MKRRMGTADVERDLDAGTSGATVYGTSGLGPEQGTWGMTAEAAGAGPLEYGTSGGKEEAGIVGKPLPVLMLAGLGLLAVGLVLMTSEKPKRSRRRK